VFFKLELPTEAKIHDVFHISVLKKFRGDKFDHHLPLPLQYTEQCLLLAPHSIINCRTVLQDGKEVNQVLVQWGKETLVRQHG